MYILNQSMRRCSKISLIDPLGRISIVGRQLVSTISTFKKQFLFKSNHMFREVIDDFAKLHTCTNLPCKEQ